MISQPSTNFLYHKIYYKKKTTNNSQQYSNITFIVYFIYNIIKNEIYCLNNIIII